ncbi:MAG: DUF4443 domain-containing protein [Nitrosopumilaceae archaeon]
MRTLIKTLQKVVSRRGSSKVLSFSAPHVFKALQLLYRESYVSRTSFCKELHMGEGAVKTLILHLKEEGLVDSLRSGTFLTKKGQKFTGELLKIISGECDIPKCSISLGKNNHVILLRNFAKEIKSGIEQRDASMLYGATGAITLLYHKNKFVFPNEEIDCLQKDKKVRSTLLENLKPHEGDVIIIATASEPFVAEISAKSSALFTLAQS